MSKDFPQFNEEDADKASAPTKPKRASAARGRKPASDKKSKPAEKPKDEVKVVQAPVAEAKVAREEKPAAKTDAKWEEAVPESVGGGTAANEGGSKRKRRRRKGKGGGGGSAAVEAGEATQVAHSPVPPAPQPVKTRLDPETLAKAAWKIYLAEVSEEGVALVGDQDARELARRCFRLAEIFLEERGRRG